MEGLRYLFNLIPSNLVGILLSGSLVHQQDSNWSEFLCGPHWQFGWAQICRRSRLHMRVVQYVMTFDASAVLSALLFKDAQDLKNVLAL